MSLNKDIIYIKQIENMLRVLVQGNKCYIMHSHDLRGGRIAIGAHSIMEIQGGDIGNRSTIGNGCITYEYKLFDHVDFTKNCRIDTISENLYPSLIRKSCRMELDRSMISGILIASSFVCEVVPLMNYCFF